MPAALTQVLKVVGEGGSPALAQPVRILNEDGTEFTVPAAATATVPGTVKKAAATSVVTAANATAAAAETVTKAEFDAVVTLCNALKTAVNGVIQAQRAAGQADGNAS